MYKLGDFNIRATYSNGFKAPTLKELHDDYITQIGGGPWKHYYGNKDLKPQKSNYYSASDRISCVEPADHGNRILQPYQEHDRPDRDPDKRRRPIG